MSAPEPTDRQAYLEEQIERQKRGEAIDVAWVQAELARIREQQAAALSRTQRHLRWLVLAATVILAVLWVKNGGLNRSGSWAMLALVLIGFLAAFSLGRRRR